MDQAEGQSVLVMGAGLAGLTCANELVQKKFRVQIIEPMNRVGGRVISDEEFSDYKIELGAEAVHSSKTPYIKFLRSVGVKFYEAREFPTHIYDREEEEFVSEKKFFKKYPYAKQVHEQLGDNYSKINPKLTLREYLDPQFKDAGHYFEAVLGADYASTTSLLSAQGVGEQETLFTESVSYSLKNKNLSQCINEGFKNIIPFVRLQQQVTKVNYTEKGVDVEILNLQTQSTTVEHFDKVVCTVPMTQLLKINWQPCLPESKTSIIMKTIQMQKGAKMFIELNEEILDEDIAVGIIFDAMPTIEFWNSSSETEHLLTGLVAGEAYEFVHREGLEKYVAYFEKIIRDQTGQKNLKIINYKLQDWGTTPFVEGLYTSPGIGYQSCQRLELGKNINNVIYFCGEAYHRTHPGTMHAAYETALKTASEIIEGN